MITDEEKRPILTKSQWIGVGVFVSVIAIVITLLVYIPQWMTQPISEDSLILSQTQAETLERKLDSIEEQRSKRYKRREKTPIRLQPFDPNTADSVTLCEVGMPSWMARNILRYRAKGGKFRTPEALKKTYGMTDSLFTTLQPYIQIDTTLFAKRDTIRWATDTTFVKKDYKEKRDTILELNSADTASLQLIRGIGKYTAIQIVRYRTQLGGYASVEQLREIDNLPTVVDSIMPYFTVCPDSIQPIRVNRASVEYLNRHPYLSFTQAKAIYELRRNEIRLTTIDQIKETGLFTEEDLSRLVPYLSFE